MELFHIIMNGLIKGAIITAKVTFVFVTIFVTFLGIIFSMTRK